MSLFGRIALISAALFVAAAVLALAVWMPASRDAFAAGSDRLLQQAHSEFGGVATALVDDAMQFSAAVSLAADEQRALAIQDLPLDLFTNADGQLEPGRLREALRAFVADPEGATAEKHAAVRAEILDHTRRDADQRLERLRSEQALAAQDHAGRAAWRTVAAWGGVLLLLLAGWAIILDRVVLRPVREVTAAVGRFGAGERGVRLDPSGAAELAALGQAFNETAAAVERTEGENAGLRAGLEEQVRERTDALVRAARASTVGTMAGGVAHEFNNLLGGILGCAEAALEEQPTPAIREAVVMIRKTAERGVGVTRALLRATSTRLEPASCDPGALFEEALAEVRPPEGVEVVSDFRSVELEADAAMLRSVLANLVRNAVEAMEGEGRLELGVRREGEQVLLTVGDSGPGIDPSVRDVLFEPFVTTRHGGREGVGLGLFLAERLVSAHGGRISVRSDPEGGTTFLIHLPSARDS